MDHPRADTNRDSTTGRRRQLQAEDFHRLLNRLDPDPARASNAYEKLRHRLVKFFWKNQNFLEAEELADRALDEIAKKPDSYEIRDVGEFAIGVARLLRLEKSRRSRPAVHIDDCEDVRSTDEDPERTMLQGIDAERKLGCFLKCVEGLKPEERWLILEYYPAESCDLEGRRRRMAVSMGIDTGALTSRMNRLRNKLVKCCALCLRGPRGR